VTATGPGTPPSAPPTTSPDSPPRPRRPVSLRVYLVGLVVLFVVAAGANFLYQRDAALTQAHRTALRDARFAATLAAKNMAAAVGQVQQGLATTARTPGLAKVLNGHPNCTLAFDGAAPFVTGHLDVISADGAVHCSSLAGASGQPYHAAAWLPGSRKAAVVTGPVTDPRTGKLALVITSPIGGQGTLAALLDLGALGPALTSGLGGPLHLAFAVTTADGRRVVTSSENPGHWAGAPLAGTAFARALGQAEHPDLSGVTSLFGHATASKLGWQVYASVRKAGALAAAHASSTRDLIISLIGLAVFLAALWVIYRRVARPISKLSEGVRGASTQPDPAPIAVRGPAEVSTLVEDFNELIAAAAQRRELAERLRRSERADEQERELRLLADRDRIARDLHDTVIQQVFATGLSLASASQLITDEVARKRVDKSVAELDGVLRQIRNVIFAAQREQSGGVRDSVLSLTREATRVLGFEPTVAFTGPVDTLIPDYVADQLLATLREAVSNVARHADARWAEVNVTVGDDIVLTVQDDGVGLRPVDHPGGLGLENMRARAEQLGGHFTAEPRNGGGTSLGWRVPLPDTPATTQISS
jgi:signal transduction histidine kinase